MRKYVKVVSNLVECPFCKNVAYVYMNEMDDPIFIKRCEHATYEYYDYGDGLEFVFETPEEKGG